MKSIIRMQMLESNLKREASQALVRLGILDCQITRTSISKDLSYASVYCVYSKSYNLDLDEKAAKKLSDNAGKIAQMVSSRWSSYRFPKLRFISDKQIREEEKLLQKLDQIAAEMSKLEAEGEEGHDCKDEENIENDSDI